jgi:hypothetical protein
LEADDRRQPVEKERIKGPDRRGAQIDRDPEAKGQPMNGDRPLASGDVGDRIGGSLRTVRSCAAFA